MHYSPRIIALLLCMTLCASAARLPEASRITDRLLRPEASISGEDAFAKNLSKIKAAESPDQRTSLWLGAYIELAQALQRTNDWEKRERLQKQLVTLGEQFPEKREWSSLEDRLVASSEGKLASTKALHFLLALLQDDEERALQLLPQAKKSSQTAQTPSGASSLIGALMGISTSRHQMDHLEPIYQLAVQQTTMPELQRRAYEHVIRFAEKNPGRFYGQIPDLTQLYEGSKLEEEIGRLVRASGDSLNPYGLPKNLVPQVFAYIKENDLVPNEIFIQFLNQSSPTYAEDIAYFESKRSGLPASNEVFQIKISKALKAGDVETAWSEWEKFAESSSEEAANYIKTVFGYQSRNYPQETVVEIAKRLLDVAETPALLNILKNALPLDSGKNDSFLARVRTVKASAFEPKTQIALTKIELDRLLALGLEQEAAATAGKILEHKDRFGEQLASQSEHQNIFQYARAFDLIDRPDTAAGFISIAEDMSATMENYQRESFFLQWARYYQDKGQLTEAFTVLFEALAPVTPASLKNGNAQIAGILAALVGLYAENAQYEDAVYLLDHAIGWQAADLSRVSVYSPKRVLQVDAAKALHKTGRTKAAERILKDYLRYEDNSEDAGYQLLIEIEGQRAASFFQALAEEAPFEERPLIWQAVLLKEHGDLAAAEEMARKAISIDPTDGEKGAEDRLRAYAVLRDILKARNNDEEAIFKNVVAAVDLAEVADEYRIAGLYLHALKIYRESLDLFADAYCVRFRAAVELEAAGKIAEAEKHFEAAYSLMPDQFGRIESHCFGCEGAFDGPRAESIAERVFTRLLEKKPEQASLHYLMGYLNKSRERPEEAMENFKQAVAIDPLYYNAWNQLKGLAEQAGNYDLSLNASRAMLEIAPRRTMRSLGNLAIVHVGALWNTLEEILPIVPPRSEEIYRLDAAAEAMAASSYGGHMMRSYEDFFQTPGEVLFRNYDVIRFITESLNTPY